MRQSYDAVDTVRVTNRERVIFPEGKITKGELADYYQACVQMGTIEFLGWGARIEDVEKAYRLVFDLIPDEGLDSKNVVSAAFHVQQMLSIWAW